MRHTRAFISDERFDKVDARFEQTASKEQLAKLESDTKERFTAVEKAIAEVGQKVDRMNRTLVGGLIAIVAAAIGKFIVS